METSAIEPARLEKRPSEGGADPKFESGIAERAGRHFGFPALECASRAITVLNHMGRLKDDLLIRWLPQDFFGKHESVFMPADMGHAARSLARGNLHKKALQFSSISAGRIEAESMIRQLAQEIVAATD